MGGFFVSDKQPFFSIVVPIYNAEKYLKKCIKSILCQKFENFELILVDDGSTDSSPAICKNFANKDSRIKYFRKVNGGSLQSRVYGAEKSLGKYIFFCDADDYYVSKDCFCNIHHHLSKEDVDFAQFKIISQYYFIKKKTNDSNKTTIISKEEFAHRDYPLLMCSFFPQSRISGNVWNKVYKRDLLSKLPPSDKINKIFMGDDFIINLYLLNNINKAMLIDLSVYVYRKLLGGTSSFKKDIMKEVTTLKDFQSAFLKDWEGPGKDAIIRMHFAETAGWLYSYAQNGLKFLSEDELKEKIKESLELSNVKRAREYLKTNNEDYPEFKLLVAGDPDLYIEKAKEIIKNQPLKVKIKNLIFSAIKKILG